jgi:hypothetical protein
MFMGSPWSALLVAPEQRFDVAPVSLLSGREILCLDGVLVL